MKIQGNLTVDVLIFLSFPFQARSKIMGLLCPKGSLLHGGKLKLLTVKNMPYLIEKLKIMKSLCHVSQGKWKQRVPWRTWKDKDWAFLSQTEKGGCSYPYLLPATPRVAPSSESSSCVVFLERLDVVPEVSRPGEVFPSYGWCRIRELCGFKEQEGLSQCSCPCWPRWHGVNMLFLIFQAPHKLLRFL